VLHESSTKTFALLVFSPAEILSGTCRTSGDSLFSFRYFTARRT